MKLLLSVLTACLAACMPLLVSAQPDLREETINRIEAHIENLSDLEASAGFAMAIVAGEKVLLSHGYGVTDRDNPRPVTDDSLFYIASTSKSFMGFLGSLLDYREQMDLDQPLSQFLPEAALRSPLSADTVTLRSLLTHTHGIRQWGPIVFRTAYSGRYSDYQLTELLSLLPAAPSGTAFQYGNIGYNIANLAVNLYLGTDARELMVEELFRPLGMKDTSSRISAVETTRLAMPHEPATAGGQQRLPLTKEDSNMNAGSGGHVSTARDMARWLVMHINEGRVSNRQVFPATLIAANHEKQVNQDNDFLEYYHRDGWALGWDIAEYRNEIMYQRFGGYGGYFSHLSFMPEHGIGVVVLTNTAATGGLIATELANSAYDMLMGKSVKAVDEVREQIDLYLSHLAADIERRSERDQQLAHPLSAYIGTYFSPAIGRMDWYLVDNKLRMSIGVQKDVPVEVYSAENNILRVSIAGSGMVVEFEFEGDEATGLNFFNQRFERL